MPNQSDQKIILPREPDDAPLKRNETGNWTNGQLEFGADITPRDSRFADVLSTLKTDEMLTVISDPEASQDGDYQEVNLEKVFRIPLENPKGEPFDGHCGTVIRTDLGYRVVAALTPEWMRYQNPIDGLKFPVPDTKLSDSSLSNKLLTARRKLSLPYTPVAAFERLELPADSPFNNHYAVIGHTTFGSYVAVSNIGGRPYQQDGFLVLTREDGDSLFSTKDGLGGELDGEKVTRLLKNYMVDRFRDGQDLTSMIEHALPHLNKRILFENLNIIQGGAVFNAAQIGRNGIRSIVHTGDTRSVAFGTSRSRRIKKPNRPTILYETVDHTVGQVQRNLGMPNAGLDHMVLSGLHIKNNRVEDLGASYFAGFDDDENGIALYTGDSFLGASDGFWGCLNEWQRYPDTDHSEAALQLYNIIDDLQSLKEEGHPSGISPMREAAEKIVTLIADKYRPYDWQKMKNGSDNFNFFLYFHHFDPEPGF